MHPRIRVPGFARLLVIAVLPALAASCGGGGDAPPVTQPVATATLRGVAFNLGGSGLPLGAAAITASPAAGAGTSTNALGQFTLSIPAGTTVAVTAAKSGFASHPMSFHLDQGVSGSTTCSLLPIGITQLVSAATGGKVTHTAANAAITLPAGFLSSASLSAEIRLTALDPTTVRALAMPGTFAGINLLGSASFLRPLATADVAIEDGAGGAFTLAVPGQLELPIPAALTGLPSLVPGAQVQCFRYDAAAGLWRAFVYGTVVTSSVNAQPAIQVALDRGGWITAALVYGSAARVSGVVTSAGLPVADADVQAYPGGTTRTDATGSYSVQVSPEAPIQVVASRGSVSAIGVGSVAPIAGAVGTTTSGQNISLQSTGGGLTYTVRAQLMRGRDAIGVLRDEALVGIVANTTPTPLPVDGARAEINPGTGWIDLPAFPSQGAGIYGKINGMNGTLNLATGATYQLRVDIENDGVWDVSGSIVMPGRPVIDAPTASSTQPESFTASWTDPGLGITGYSARYVGSFESASFGVFPSRFVMLTPAQSKRIGDGITDATHQMPNDPLFSGSYTFRLWATNGPIEYVLPTVTLFATPNLSGTGVIGYFSAIAQADSVGFTSLGSGEPGPARLRPEWGRPARARGPAAQGVAGLRR